MAAPSLLASATSAGTTGKWKLTFPSGNSREFPSEWQAKASQAVGGGEIEYIAPEDPVAKSTAAAAETSTSSTTSSTSTTTRSATRQAAPRKVASRKAAKRTTPKAGGGTDDNGDGALGAGTQDVGDGGSGD